MRYRNTFTEDFFGVTGDIESTREIATLATEPTDTATTRPMVIDEPVIATTTDPDPTYTVEELAELQTILGSNDPATQPILNIFPPEDEEEGFEETPIGAGYSTGGGGGGGAIEVEEEEVFKAAPTSNKKKIIMLVLVAVAIYIAYRVFGKKKAAQQ